MHDVQEAAADEFSLGVAEHFAQRRIDGSEAQIEPRHRLSEGTLLEHPAKPLLAVAQRGFGKLALGDVDIDTAAMHRQTGGVAKHTAAASYPAQFTVRPDDPILCHVFVGTTGQRIIERVLDAVAVFGMAEPSRGLYRHRIRCRRQPHDAEELHGAAQVAGREVDVPDADTRGFLCQGEEFFAITELRGCRARASSS